ncbi:MAG TPA: site-specific DNA-methyltransferase [Tepidisphaeraceae bacterium]|nr:site-specific DNA-methyltransferase [Tepidisphaeraceae bacterium]
MEALLRANLLLRDIEWPAPFNRTEHRVLLGDARGLDWIPDQSVHLVVTSPPYWTLKEYREHDSQMGAIEEYSHFLDELDRVWWHCYRALVPGGRVCCVVGDVCVARKEAGRHQVIPLHSDIQVRARKLGFENLTPILWHKISNGALETEGNGAGFYGKPYQPGAIVKNDVEYILFFRKGGKYRSVGPAAKALSMMTKQEMQSWFRSIWTDVPGASTQKHPAPYPLELAMRLIRMFSFAGDTVLDPFLGTGTTVEAAMDTGRNSVGVEIDPEYLAMAKSRLSRAAKRARHAGATEITFEGGTPIKPAQDDAK